MRRRRFRWAVRRLPGWLGRLAEIGVLPSNPPPGLARIAYLAFLQAFNRGDLVTAFASLAPHCEFRSVEGLLEEPALFAGRAQVIRYFEEVRDLVPDWRVENMRFVRGAKAVFVALDQGRGTGRTSGAPVALDLASVIELRHGLVMRVHQYSQWEHGLSAVGLDPATAAEVRAERSGN